MAIVTTSFDEALAPFGEAVTKKKSFFNRLVAALMESRRLAADREIARHEHLIASVSSLSKAVATKRDELPF